MYNRNKKYIFVFFSNIDNQRFIVAVAIATQKWVQSAIEFMYFSTSVAERLALLALDEETPDLILGKTTNCCGSLALHLFISNKLN